MEAKTPSVLEMGRKTAKKKMKKRKKKNTKNPLGMSRNLCLMLAGLLLSAAIYLFVTKEFELAIVALLLILGLLHCVVKEVQEAWAAAIFRFGKFVGEKGPGLAVCLSPIWRFKLYYTGRQPIELPKVTMYKKDATKVFMESVVVTFWIESIEKIVRVKDYQKRLVSVTLAKLKAKIGELGFTGKGGLLVEKGAIEDAIRDGLNEEMKEWGCEIEDVEISHYTEKVHSEAAAEKVLARGQRAKAQAFAEPLKDNYPAAIGMIGTEGVKSLIEILGRLIPEEKKGKE